MNYVKNHFKNMFNKHCFIFLFVLYIKKVSYYVSILLYQAIIILFICLSLIRGDEPTYFFANPISITFLIFLLTVISSYISTDIYKTPIEDGSELLIVSKPLNRANIFISKISIISMFGLINALVALPVTAICFAFPNSVHSYSLIALFGIPIASLVIYLAFASISLFISIFLKKSLALITVSIFNIIMLFFSIINIFVVDIKSKSNSSFSSSYKISNVLTMDEDNEIKQTNVISSNSQNDFKEDYLNNYSKRLYPKLIPINFYQQLSNMYGLNKQFTYLSDESYMGNADFNYPFHYSFDFSKNALTPENVTLKLNLNEGVDNGFSIPFYFTLSSYDFSYLQLGEHKTINFGGIDYEALEWDFIQSQNKGDNSFLNFMKEDNNYFNQSNWLSSADKAIHQYITDKTSPLYEDTRWYVENASFDNDINFLNYYGFFINISKLSKYTLSHLFVNYYDSKSMSEKDLLIQLNKLVLSFLNEKLFEVNIKEINEAVQEWASLYPQTPGTYKATRNAEKEEFYNKHKDTLINLIKLNMLGFDLVRYFYGLDEMLGNKEISSLPQTAAIWEYFDPVNQANENSVYNKVMNDYLNPNSSLYRNFIYYYVDSSIKYVASYYQLFYKPVSTPFLTNKEDNYTFTIESYFDTSSLFIGWILFLILLNYVSFLLFRRRDVI